MDESKFIVFKYDHGDRQPLTPLRKKVVIGLLVAAVVCLFFEPGMGAAFILAALVAFAWGKAANARLYLGPRYMLCGKSIVYYRNIGKIAVDEKRGMLTLLEVNGRSFRIEKKKFPTGARKTHKIEVNTAAKFAKFRDKIVTKVSAAVPEVQVVTI